MTRCIRYALLCLCLVASSSASASRQDQLEQLRKRISNLQQELEKTNESKSEVTDSLRDSERAISDSKRKLNGLAEQQRDAQRTLQQLQLQARRLETDVQGQQARLGDLLYQQYTGGGREYLKLILDGRDPNQTARDIQYYEYIARSRAAWLKSLRTDLAQLREVTLQTQQKSKEIAGLQAEQAVQRSSLEQDKRIRMQVLRKISTQLKQQRREITRLQRDESRLAQLVKRLSKMLARPKGKGNGQFLNDSLPDNNFSGSPFDALKGKLHLPAKGVVSNRFGSRRPDSTVLWKGLFLRAAADQPVKAVAAGRVVFADWMRGFGNLLIIDHGKGYMSLYGNNETLYKQVGDVISGGDTVAAVGNSGGNEDYGLYFELRHEGIPLDPMQWVARRPRG